MTINLGLRLNDAVVLGYDTLYVRLAGGEYHGHKAHVDGTGTIALGVAGTFGTEFVRGINSYMNDLTAAMYSRRSSVLSAADSVLGLDRSLIMDFFDGYLKGDADPMFMIAYFQAGHAQLAYNDRYEMIKSAKCSCHGIGNGMFPEVRDYLHRGYRRSLSLEGAIAHCRRTIDLAKRIDIEKNEKRTLEGFGFTVIGCNGISQVLED